MIIDGREFDRTQGIGGSDMPIIVGMSPYRSAIDLWAEKRGETIDREPTLAMKLGSLLEDGIAQVYADQEQVRIVKPKLPVGIRNDLTVDPRMEARFGFPTWAQVDRRRVGKPVRGVEVKHTASLDRFVEGQVPDDVQVQVQHAMMLTGWRSFDVVSLAGGRKLGVETVEADPDVHEALREAGFEFWRQVREGEQPEADGSDAAGRWLRERYDAEPGKVITATHDMLPTVAEVLRTGDAKKKAEQEYEAAKQRIMQLMEDAEVLEAAGGVKITWKDEPGKRSWKDIATDYRRMLEGGIDLPSDPDGDPITLADWLAWIEQMHTGEPSRVMRVYGKLVALEGRKATE